MELVCVRVSTQSGDQASGGPGVLRGGHPQQRPGRPGDHGQQAQPGETEAHAGAEYPEAGRAAGTLVSHPHTHITFKLHCDGDGTNSNNAV